MKPATLTLALLLAACSSTTAPKSAAIDPTVLIVNLTTDTVACGGMSCADTLKVTTFYGADSVRTTLIDPGTQVCKKFIVAAVADSIDFEVTSGSASYGSGWFHPAGDGRQNWLVTLEPNRAPYTPPLTVTEPATPPC